MISDHFQKVDVISNRTLFLLAGGLVIVCQLVAMAVVSDGQVKKAQLRNLGIASQQTAFAQCLEASIGIGIGNGGHRCSVLLSSAGRQSDFSGSRAPSELEANRGEAPTRGVSTAVRYGNAEGFALSQITDSQADALRMQSPSPALMPLVYIGQQSARRAERLPGQHAIGRTSQAEAF